MTSRCLALLALAGLLGGLAPPARAQAVEPRDEAARDAEARRLFEAGRTAFESALLDVALSCFRRAFELSGRPALLYNIGLVEQRLGHVPEALRAFERFLAEAPEDPGRADVEARIEVLRDVRASARPPRATAAARAPATAIRPPRGEEPRRAPAARARRPRGQDAARARGPAAAGSPTPSAVASPWPWLITGGGALVTAAGVVLLVAATGDAAAVEDARDGTPWRDVSDRAERAPGLFVAGELTLGVGLAAIAAGLGWAILGDRPSGRRADRAGVRLGAAGLRVRFP